jgi:hypothetical protein
MAIELDLARQATEQIGQFLRLLVENLRRGASAEVFAGLSRDEAIVTLNELAEACAMPSRKEAIVPAPAKNEAARGGDCRCGRWELPRAIAANRFPVKVIIECPRCGGGYGVDWDENGKTKDFDCNLPPGMRMTEIQPKGGN